jgi:hypothetical protein
MTRNPPRSRNQVNCPEETSQLETENSRKGEVEIADGRKFSKPEKLDRQGYTSNSPLEG